MKIKFLRMEKIKPEKIEPEKIMCISDPEERGIKILYIFQ